MQKPWGQGALSRRGCWDRVRERPNAHSWIRERTGVRVLQDFVNPTMAFGCISKKVGLCKQRNNSNGKSLLLLWGEEKMEMPELSEVAATFLPRFLVV